MKILGKRFGNNNNNRGSTTVTKTKATANNRKSSTKHTSITKPNLLRPGSVGSGSGISLAHYHDSSNNTLGADTNLYGWSIGEVVETMSSSDEEEQKQVERLGDDAHNIIMHRPKSSQGIEVPLVMTYPDDISNHGDDDPLERISRFQPSRVVVPVKSPMKPALHDSNHRNSHSSSSSNSGTFAALQKPEEKKSDLKQVENKQQSTPVDVDALLDEQEEEEARRKQNLSKKTSGPVDVDKYMGDNNNITTPTSKNKSKNNTKSHLHPRAADDFQADVGMSELFPQESHRQDRLSNEDLNFSYCTSSPVSTCSGALSDGDSLVNLGDNNLEYNTPIRSSATRPMNLENMNSERFKSEEEAARRHNLGLSTWLTNCKPTTGKTVDVYVKEGRVGRKMTINKQKERVRVLKENNKKANLMKANEKASSLKKEKSEEDIKATNSAENNKKKKSISKQVKTKIQSLISSNGQKGSDKKVRSKPRTSLEKPQLRKDTSLVSMIPVADPDAYQPTYEPAAASALVSNTQKVKCSANMEKPHLKKDISAFSTTTLAGDAELDFPTKPRLQAAKETLLDEERQKVLSSRLEQRREKKQQQEREHRIYKNEMERQQQQRLQSKSGESKGGKYSTTPITKEQIQSHREREKLQRWVMGCSTLTLGSSSGDQLHSPMTFTSLLSDNESKSGSGSSNRTPHDASTVQVDNTLQNPNTIKKQRDLPNKTEPALTQEHSSAQHKCVVCKKRDRTHLALPCMHFSYCEICVSILEKQEKKSCQVCNEKNVTFSKVLY